MEVAVAGNTKSNSGGSSNNTNDSDSTLENVVKPIYKSRSTSENRTYSGKTDETIDDYMNSADDLINQSTRNTINKEKLKDAVNGLYNLLLGIRNYSINNYWNGIRN